MRPVNKNANVTVTHLTLLLLTANSFSSTVPPSPLRERRRETWRAAHLGQGLVRLLRGAAVSLGDVTEGEGHVLQREVASWERGGGKDVDVAILW